MTKLVPAEDIERIVGTNRHPTKHFGRAVSSEQTVYILHPQECLNSGMDLRGCDFSIALDAGISMVRWRDFEDQPVELWISAATGQLIPLRRCDG